MNEWNGLKDKAKARKLKRLKLLCKVSFNLLSCSTFKSEIEYFLIKEKKALESEKFFIKNPGRIFSH